MFFSIFAMTQNSFGQTYDIRLSDALGNPQVVKWPPPDTSYYPNKVILKFKRSALKLENLCYTYGFDDNLSNTEKKVEKPMSYLTYNQKIYLHSQRFTPHQVTSDSLLANAMLIRGIDSLKRLTSANPCEDTISISILGDTVVCEDYLFFEANITNDTSVINTCTLLTMFFQNSLFYVEPNYIPILCGVPSDPRYVNQKAFHQNLMDIESAWDFEVGIPEIQIGIVDDGIEYDKCEFNRINYLGSGYKVAYGFNYANSQDVEGIKRVPWHGTGVASVAAALTNHHTSFCHDGIAGVAGGWGESNYERGIGCELYALKAFYTYDTANGNRDKENIIGALRESVSRNPRTGYGNQVDVLNCSFVLGNTYYLKEAIQYAFVNNVSVVAARGNSARSFYWYFTNRDSQPDSLFIPNQNGSSLALQTDAFNQYPASYEEHLITCVGASGETNPILPFSTSHIKDRVGYSQFGRTLDFLISTGERYHNPVNDLNIWNLISDSAGPGYTETGGWEQADGTSVSAGLASGIIGLLRSYAFRKGFFDELEPEDYEGMMKASAEDVVGTRRDPYATDFDIYSGWGHVNIGNAFRMLKDGYRVIKASSTAVTFSDWDVHPQAKVKSDYKVIFAKATDWNASQIDSSHHKVKVRTVTGQVVVPNIFDFTYPIFAWGVSGRNKPSGWTLSNPQMQHGFTFVSDNEGGNMLTPGIIHHRGGTYTKNGIIEAKNFQYALVNDTTPGEFVLPPTETMGVNISIFGKLRDFVSVQEEVNINGKYSIFPTITRDYITIQFNEIALRPLKIRVRSLLGDLVADVNVDLSNSSVPQHINLRHLPVGSYFVEISDGKYISNYKCMVVR
jgi:hypothetical protein